MKDKTNSKFKSHAKGVPPRNTGIQINEHANVPVLLALASEIVRTMNHNTGKKF